MIEVSDEHFSTFKVLEHGASCPDESVDIFEMPGARRFADMYSEMNMQHMGSMGYSEIPGDMDQEFS